MTLTITRFKLLFWSWGCTVQ